MKSLVGDWNDARSPTRNGWSMSSRIFRSDNVCCTSNKKAEGQIARGPIETHAGLWERIRRFYYSTARVAKQRVNRRCRMMVETADLVLISLNEFLFVEDFHGENLVVKDALNHKHTTETALADRF